MGDTSTKLLKAMMSLRCQAFLRRLPFLDVCFHASSLFVVDLYDQKFTCLIKACWDRVSLDLRECNDCT